MFTKSIQSVITAVLLLACLFGCSEVDPQASGNDETNQGQLLDAVYMQAKYMTFEECLSSATHIVTATYTGRYDTHNIYQDLAFVPVTQYKGTVPGDEFRLRCMNSAAVEVEGDQVGVSHAPTEYQAGVIYLLVLEKHVSVYLPYDVYTNLGNIHIVDGESATMYQNSSISAHSAALSEQGTADVIPYIVDYIQKDQSVASVVGYDYIRSEEIADIVRDTTFILEVVPKTLVRYNSLNDTELYLCRVTKTHKGTVEEAEINVTFPKGAVALEGEYMVLLERHGELSSYSLSSKNSIYPLSEQAKIRQVKEAIELYSK